MFQTLLVSLSPSHRESLPLSVVRCYPSLSPNVNGKESKRDATANSGTKARRA